MKRPLIAKSFDKNTSGFTLMELIFTLAIVAILATIAVPAYNQLIVNNRQTVAVNQFIGALNTARSEAVKRGVQVAVCARDGHACGDVDWHQGWLVFVDDDGDGEKDNNEELITESEPLRSGFTLVGETDIANKVQFIADGRAIASGTVTLCDGRGADYAKSVIVNSTGRTKAAKVNATGGALSCL